MKTTTFGTILMIHLNLSLRITHQSATAISKAMGITQSSLQRSLSGDAELTVSRMYDFCHHADVSAAYLTQLSCEAAELLKGNGWTIVEKTEQDDLLTLWKTRDQWSWEIPIGDIFKKAAGKVR